MRWVCFLFYKASMFEMGFALPVYKASMFLGFGGR